MNWGILLVVGIATAALLSALGVSRSLWTIAGAALMLGAAGFAAQGPRHVPGKPVAAVCHAPAVLRHAKALDGSALVKGKSVTGFSNTEEAAVQLTDVVPFLLEDDLTAKGAIYSKSEDWHPYAVTDGMLMTGQNPASSELVARALLEALQ